MEHPLKILFFLILTLISNSLFAFACNEKHISNCSEEAIGEFQAKNYSNALKFSKLGCQDYSDFMSCSIYAESAAKMGNQKLAIEIHDKNCQITKPHPLEQSKACEAYSEYLKEIHMEKKAQEIMNKACQIYYSKKCKNLHSTYDKKENSHIKNPNSIGPIDLIKKMNDDCEQNDARACYSFGILFNKSVVALSPRELSIFLKNLKENKINTDTNYYFKKSCQLNYKEACHLMTK